MITKDRVLEIISNRNPGELEQIHVITRYIFDKTGEDISSVGVNPPRDQGLFNLMLHMYEVAKQYYSNGEK